MVKGRRPLATITVESAAKMIEGIGPDYFTDVCLQSGIESDLCTFKYRNVEYGFRYKTGPKREISLAMDNKKHIRVKMREGGGQ